MRDKILIFFTFLKDYRPVVRLSRLFLIIGITGGQVEQSLSPSHALLVRVLFIFLFYFNSGKLSLNRRTFWLFRPIRDLYDFDHLWCVSIEIVVICCWTDDCDYWRRRHFDGCQCVGWAIGHYNKVKIMEWTLRRLLRIHNIWCDNVVITLKSQHSRGSLGLIVLV